MSQVANAHERPFVSYKGATGAEIPVLVQLDQLIFPGSAYPREAWVGELNTATVILALASNEPVGFISVARVGDDIEIRKIGVLAGERRVRVAQNLLRVAAQAFAGAERILIDVAADNQAGIAFYSRCGSREIARRRNYYPGGADAIVMAIEGEALHKIMSAPSAK